MNMKKTLVSLAAVAALTTGAMAADKGIDIKTTGQAVVYYNTAATNKSGSDLFNNGTGDNTRANFGIQLNLDANLKNGFTFGSTINYLGTLGLEKNLVNNVMQSTNGTVTEDTIADDIYLSQLYIAKQMGNTTLKLGRQELPKSLSPFAFSEGWNVFKNTFDAILAVNTDIPNTAVVLAYVAKGNGNGFGHNMSVFDDLKANGAVTIADTAYLLTVQNKSIPMATITASYYDLARAQVATNEGVKVMWGDVAIAGKDLPMGLKIGLQGGSINPEASALDNTSAYGVKVGLKPIKALALCVAYTSVDDGTVAVQNVGGAKTPLYTQMVANQGAIKSDNNTYMVKGVYNAGDYGKIIGQVSVTSDESATDRDLTDSELLYKFKASGVNFLAAYINQSWSKKNAAGVDGQDIVRFVARYKF